MSADKNIRSVVLDDGNSYAIVDLEDAPRSIEVSLSDGVVTFREGLTPGRIHGWVLTPDAVEYFFVDRVDGRYAIRLSHKRCGVQTTHFVGFVQDQLTAEKWVERVNAVYSERISRKLERSRGRSTEYREYPVVNDILEKKVNIVLPGSYQYSWQRQLPNKKLSIWEDAYVNRCMDLLARDTGISRQSLSVDVRGFMPHDYEWLSDRVFYDSHNFENRITQPLELIFDRQQRHDKIGVNSFCFVRSFALVYFKKSKVKTILGGTPASDISPTFGMFLDMFKQWINEQNLLLCAPASQSVYYTFYDAHCAGHFDLYQHFSRRHDIDSLAVWLWQNAACGAVACDLGEVHPLSISIAKLQGCSPHGLLEYVKVPYERPVPIGFCYRKDDEMWAKIERESLIDTIEHPQGKIRKDFDAFRRRVTQIGIEVAA